MEPNMQLADYARQILKDIFDHSNCSGISEVVGKDEFQRLCSSEERLRLDWGFWMASLAVNMIAFTHETENLSCSEVLLNKIIDHLDKLLPSFIPQDSRPIRIGSMVTNKSELEFLKSSGFVQHSFFNPAASRTAGADALARAVYQRRIACLADSFHQGLLLHEASEAQFPACSIESFRSSLKGIGLNTEAGFGQMAIKYWSFVSDSGLCEASPHNIEVVALLEKVFEDSYVAFRRSLSEVDDSRQS